MTKSVFFQAQPAIVAGLIASIGAAAVSASVGRVNEQTEQLLGEFERATSGTGTPTLPDPDTGLIGLTGEIDGYTFDYRLRFLTNFDDIEGGRYTDRFEGGEIPYTITTVVTLPDGETTQTYEQKRLQEALATAGVPGAQQDPLDALLAALLGSAGRPEQAAC